MLRPNDLGMFDMLGSVMELRLTKHDRENESEFSVEDTEDADDITTGVGEPLRQMKGGAHLYQPSNARVSHRDNIIRPYSTCLHPFMGFRAARTIPSK